MSKSLKSSTHKHNYGLDAEARTYLSRQALSFEKMLPELLTSYRGQWVLFEDNQVLDADFDYSILLERVRKTMGERIVLIKKVEPVSTHS